jgi:hypothetical protein
MQISKSIETKDGTVKFEGEISGTELDIVLQFGLLSLMKQGVIQSFTAKPGDEEPIH